MKPADVGDDIGELRHRLEEAEETLRAIRSGEVDALVVQGLEGEQVFTLKGADHPYRALIEAMQQGAVCLNGEGTILYCNHSFAEMLKLPHKKILGAAMSQFVPPSQQAAYEHILGQAPTEKGCCELEFAAADGSLLPVYVALAPLAFAESAALGLVITDLTEQKKHQELQETNRRKDEFLAMLAHELRNPLAPIQNAVAILEHFAPGSEKLIYAREIIGRQVLHLSRLVDDLLEVSRITLGKVKLQRELVQLASVIVRAVETSRPAIDARRHQLTVSLPPKDVCVDADPTRLTQVIGNLLTNAAKYTDEGGQITLVTEADNEQVTIRVRDNGIGMTTELLPRVFELFMQGDRALDRAEGGLGIGLTLVRRLVEMHGGTVEARSDGPGRGSEFLVRLPALNAQKRRSDEMSPPVDIGGARRRILVVEDNKDGADSLGMLLTLMGHDVRIAYTGSAAIEQACAIRPHLILLDIGLPGMSGYEVANRLKSRTELNGTTIVAMTGYGQDEDRQRSREAGFRHHLVKPVDPEKLKLLLAAPETFGD